jgi:hypothetical protein
MRRLFIGLLLMVVACGQAQAGPGSSPVGAVTKTPSVAASPEPSPSVSPAASPQPGSLPAPSPSKTLLFAVKEQKAGANPWVINAVAIAGLDGRVRARTTFASLPEPSMGCMGAILPPSAHVAAGKVYYADAKGIVRSLAIDGTVKTVARFPMTSSQQMLSFAVSPDGGRVLGTIFTIPKNAFPCDGSATTAAFRFDAYTAMSGQASKLVYHLSWTHLPAKIMELTGWDALGPIGQYPSVLGTQGGGPGLALGVFVRIDPTTVKVRSNFSDPSSCMVWDSVASGAFVCLPGAVIRDGNTDAQVTDQTVSVRRAAGIELWRATVTSANGAWSPVLAPDGRHVIICCADNGGPNLGTWVLGQDKSQIVVANGFTPEGWLDSRTLVGYSDTTPAGLAFAQSSDPTRFTVVAVAGNFLGTVRT